MKPKTGFESGSSPGLAAVRDRIRQAFVTQVHGDVRDAEQVRASREMAAEIDKPVTPATPEVYCEHHAHRFHQHVERLTKVALISAHTSTKRCNVHEIVVPQETAEELFQQLLNRVERNPGGRTNEST